MKSGCAGTERTGKSFDRILTLKVKRMNTCSFLHQCLTTFCIMNIMKTLELKEQVDRFYSLSLFELFSKTIV